MRFPSFVDKQGNELGMVVARCSTDCTQQIFAYHVSTASTGSGVFFLLQAGLLFFGAYFG